MAQPTGTVTFLFTDIEGSTAAWDTHHSAMSAAQVRHDEIVKRTIDQEKGHIFATGGDGIAAAFQSARSAVTAAVEMQRAFEREPWPTPLHITVRMGINTGEAIERNGDYFGPAVIKAARLMSLVGGRRIVCSRGTAVLVEPHLTDGIQLLPVGTVRLKGLGGAEEVFAVAGTGLVERGETLGEVRSLLRGAPVASSRMVGRTAERDLIVDALARHRVVTVTGMGGMGKTRLAQAVVEAGADAFTDGVAWVDLAPAQDRDAAVHEMARALGVRPQVGEDLVTTVLHALGTRQLLLVLDNCEHLRQDIVDLVAKIGSSGNSATILATSRERLGGPDERVIPLGPLDTVDEGAALALLIERLDTVVPSDELAALDVIVTQVDGIPLAIELAAARCRSLGVAEVAVRLTKEMRLLADRNQPNIRHRTLDQVIGWSYETLTRTEQTVLRRLSVFAGAFTLDAAEQVAVDDDLTLLDVDDAISTLVDRSLVVRLPGRFRMLAPTRQFAWARPATPAEHEQSRARHLVTVAARVVAIADGLITSEEAQWVERLEAEWPDVRRAVRRAFETDDAEAVISLVIHLAGESFFRRPEVFAWIDVAVRRYGDRPGPDRPALLGAGSQVAWTTLDIERSLLLAEQSLRLESVAGESFGGLPQAGGIGAYNFSGQPRRAAAVARMALDASATVMPPSRRAFVLASESMSLALSGDEAARSTGREAIERAERAGNPTVLGFALFNMALVHQLLGGDPVESAFALDRARTLAESVANHWLLAMCTNGYIAAIAGDDPAQQVIASLDAMDDFLQSGWPANAWAAGWLIPEKLAELDHLVAAATWLGACLTCGIPRLGSSVLRQELQSACDGGGDPELRQAIATGATLPFAALRRFTEALLANI